MMVWQTRTASLLTAALLLAGTVAIGLWLNALNRDAKHRYGYAFTDLQNATTANQAQTILQRWHEKAAEPEIGKAMRVDLLFPFFYATLLALVAYRASLLRPTAWVARLGVGASLLALLAGVADLGENLTMLMMLGDVGAAPRVSLMMLFTRTKLVGIVAAIVYLILSHLDT